MNDSVGIFLLFLMYGAFFSLPAFFLYLFAFNRIVKIPISDLIIKTTLNAIGIVAVVLTFLLIKGSMMQMLMISYSISLVISSLLFNLRRKDVKQ